MKLKISFLSLLLWILWMFMDGAETDDIESTISDQDHVEIHINAHGETSTERIQRLEMLQQLQHQLEQLQDLTNEEKQLIQEAKELMEKENRKKKKMDRMKPLRKQLRPSEIFLEIVTCIEKEGITDGILIALHALAPLDQEKRGDPFAHEKIAMIELFEPNAQTHYNFTDALQHLRIAADAGIPSAQVTLALLGLIDFGPAENEAITVEKRREASIHLITTFAKEVEFVSSLILGNRLMTAPRPEMSSSSYRIDESVCNEAWYYLHRCAEINVRRLADMGGERPYEMVRLSHEYMAPGSLNEERQIQAAQQFEYYRSVAANPQEEGWAEATQRMGEAYFYGDDDAGVIQDQPRAAEFFRQAADGGEPLAMANYGMMLLNGIGVSQDNITAHRYFERGAALGNAFSMHCMGLIYYFGSSVDKNETRAIEWFEQAAEHGYMDSHTFLGSAYLYGHGVEANETRAFEHFKVAGTTQTSQSYYNLGVMYYRGVGTSPSCDKALGYLRIVATDPSLLSDLPYNLEKAYQAYQQKDFLRAYLHYRLLAELGLEDAHVNAAFLLEKYGHFIYPLTPMVWMGPQKEPLSEAYDLYQRGTVLNDIESMRRIGHCYHDGWDHNVCIRNHTKAMEWYERAAELGDSEAAYNGGVLHLMERDWTSAERFFDMCSTAVFPQNIPCVLASTVLQVRSMVLPRWMT